MIIIERDPLIYEDVEEMIQMRLEEKNWRRRAGKRRKSCGQESSAWVSSYGQELESFRMVAKMSRLGG